MDREKEIADEEHPRGNQVETDVPILLNEQELELATEAVDSSLLDNNDIYRADEFNFEYTGRYQIKESGGDTDLYSGETKLGSVIAEVDRGAYFSAIENAFAYGRGVWSSHGEDTVYATVILRSENGEYECHTYCRAIDVPEEKEPAEEEPLIEEFVELPLLPIEQLPEQVINGNFENVPTLPTEATPRFFTPRELYEHAVEVVEAEQQLEEEQALEITPVENSDDSVSVENDIIVHDDNSERAVVVLKNLETLPYGKELSIPFERIPLVSKVEQNRITIAETQQKESTEKDITVQTSEKVALPANDEKNEAIISPVTNTLEAIRLVTPEKNGAAQDINSVERIDLNRQHDSTFVIEQQRSAIAVDIMKAERLRTIESFDTLEVSKNVESELGMAVAGNIIEFALRNTKALITEQAQQVVVQDIEAPASIQEIFTIDPREVLEQSTGIHVVETRPIEVVSNTIISPAFVEDTAPQEMTSLFRLEKIALDTGISIASTMEHDPVAQELLSTTSTRTDQGDTPSVADDATAIIADIPEPLAVAA